MSAQIQQKEKSNNCLPVPAGLTDQQGELMCLLLRIEIFLFDIQTAAGRLVKINTVILSTREIVMTDL